MAVKLHKPGSDYAAQPIKEGRAVRDDRGAWSEHQPSAAEENKYIEEHGLEAYGRWHLAIDDQIGPDAKGHYKFPYGDFASVHQVRRARGRVARRPAQVHGRRTRRRPPARHARRLTDLRRVAGLWAGD